MAAVDDNQGEYLAIDGSFYSILTIYDNILGCLTISDCHYRTY